MNTKPKLLADDVRAYINDLTEKYQNLIRKIDDLSGERDLVEYAPITRKEAKELLHAYIDRLRSDNLTHFQGRINNVIQGTFAPEGGSVDFANDRFPEGMRVKEGFLLALLSESVKSSVDSLLDQVEWPAPEGLPKQAREKRLAELDKEIDKATTECQEVVNDLSEAGLVVDEDYQEVKMDLPPEEAESTDRQEAQDVTVETVDDPDYQGPKPAIKPGPRDPWLENM